MDEFIFDEHDEVDSILLCMNEIEYNEIIDEINKPISVLEDYRDEKSIDSLSVPLDDTEVSPIGMEAEIYLDADQELMLGDEEDNELIDLVGGF